MAEFIGQTQPETCSGFDNMGKPVPDFSRQKAYDTLKAIGVQGAALRRQVVVNMADRLERDKPYECVSEGMRAMDLTGTYRVMAVLLTAEPEPQEEETVS